MRSRLISVTGALLLVALAGSALLLFWADEPATAAQAATGCPITGLPPTPTSGGPFNASTIKLNEILTAPQKTDWNCDGTVNGDDQWIELKNRLFP